MSVSRRDESREGLKSEHLRNSTMGKVHGRSGELSTTERKCDG